MGVGGGVWVGTWYKKHAKLMSEWKTTFILMNDWITALLLNNVQSHKYRTLSKSQVNEREKNVFLSHRSSVVREKIRGSP